MNNLSERHNPSETPRVTLPLWVSKFPKLFRDTDRSWIDVANRAREVVIPGGVEVFNEGDACKNYIFVLNGATRVYKMLESGREIVLYRIRAGETCSLTTSLLCAGGVYPASAVTEVETHAVLMPARDFHVVFDQSRRFREFACATFGEHMRDVVMLLESVTMRNVEVRMGKWLVDRCGDSGCVDVSHRELAFELGTAREVISRHLKNYESRGWVRLNRKNIEVIDATAIRELVAGCRS